MPTLHLAWDNTAVNASSNSLGQRTSKRIKSVGGLFSTTGFTPINDLPKTANQADADVVANRIYEFKVENICSVGGPTANTDGLKEGLKFACLSPGRSSNETTVTVTHDLAGTDISKVRYTLRKVSDNTIAGAATIIVRSGDATTHTFTGLVASTAYYVESEFYATVGGVEIISSSATQLNAVCGSSTTTEVSTTAGGGGPGSGLSVTGHESPVQDDGCQSVYEIVVTTTIGNELTVTAIITDGYGSVSLPFNGIYSTPLTFSQTLYNAGIGNDKSEIVVTVTDNTSATTITRTLSRYNSGDLC